MEINFDWSQHPDNPLISPQWPEWLLGDPVVVAPEESPDGRWHMFLNTILWLYRYTSDDGIKWRRASRVCHGMRAFVLKDDDEFLLFYELIYTPWLSRIAVRRSTDLVKWSAPKALLSASLPWEKRRGVRVMSCPCVVKDGGIYRMYYSAGQVFLSDLGFPEPMFIGVAESESVDGPWIKRETPLFGPEADNPLRSLGAGAIKVYRDEANNRWIGFNNGIYNDEKGRSRSSIKLLTSADGIEWEDPLGAPVVAPDKGWRKALVYQLCMVERPDGEVWLYYNSRDGWRVGTERIGLEIGRLKNI